MNKKIVGTLIAMFFICTIFNIGLNAEFIANVVSDFESGLDGWTCNNDGTASWESSGGNPGGFFKIDESGAGTQAYAISPTKFHGNWNNFNEISVDMKRINPTNPDQSPDFEISGPGGSAIHDSPIEPGGNWVTITVPLEESYWSVTSGTWGDLIDDVTDFRFDAECDNSGPETVGIDNIILYESVNDPPFTPSNPIPINHAVEVDINTALSWIGGDPDIGDTVTYDVYFGTNSNPPIVNHNQSNTYFEPGTMNYNTKYYWKIVTWDNHGESSIGPIWDFTTGNEPNNPPNTPSNPSPENHTIDVDINADLGWTSEDPDSGDTVTYDVYFGTNSNPPIVNHNQSNTYFEPGTMNYNTKYYWKIVTWDNHGESSIGPIWDFTTGNEPNNPPNTPSNPSPENHATDVDINADLGWTSEDPDSGDTVTYDVYFGTNTNPPLHKTDHTTTIYDPGIMSYNTVYYWKIVAKDNHSASTTGPIWNFTTSNIENQPPSVNILFPQENDIVTGFVNIYGSASDPDGNETLIRVEVKIDDKSWQNATGTEYWKYSWNTVNETWGDHTIKARSYDGGIYSNDSIVNVTVQHDLPDITITGINGGFGVNVDIKNTGTDLANNVYWSIDIEPSFGLILSGSHTEDVIDELAAGDSVTIQSNGLRGIGFITISVQVADVVKQAKAFLLGPLVLRVNEV